jgi:uncharacterized lipoprotein YmbA
MKALPLVFAALSLTGCIVFDKKSEAVSFHRFEAADGAPTKAQPLVYVPRASLPASVRRPAVVLLTPGSQVLIDDAHRWSASLDRLFAETIARHVTREAGCPTVVEAPEAPHLTLILECERFEVAGDGRAALTIRYRLERADGSAVAGGTSASAEPMTGQNAPAFVAAQSRNLNKVGRAIAETLRALPASQLPSR